MDKLDNYKKIIKSVLSFYLNIKYANADISNRRAYDDENSQFIIISEGWLDNQHFHSCLIHIEIIDKKIWIQCDNTENGIANELVKEGIPKENIVLGFHEPSVRKYTGFAVA